MTPDNFWENWMGPYLISNLVAVLLMYLAWKKVQWVRYLYALMFLAASGVNSRTALRNPSVHFNYAAWDRPFHFRSLRVSDV